MSAREVLDVVTAAVADETAGLAARVRARRALTASGPLVRDDFTYDAWAPRLDGMPGTAPVVVVTQAAATRETRQGVPAAPDYRATRRVVVIVQMWESDRRVIQDAVNVYEDAVCDVFDGLRAFSDANGGTVETVGETVEVADLSLPGAAGALSDGVECTITITERSAD